MKLLLKNNIIAGQLVKKEVYNTYLLYYLNNYSLIIFKLYSHVVVPILYVSFDQMVTCLAVKNSVMKTRLYGTLRSNGFWPVYNSR